jgi:hypothetical protein
MSSFRIHKLSILAAAAVIVAAPAFGQNNQPGNPDQKGPELRLPGLPPIQLPPGTRVFGPDGETRGETKGQTQGGNRASGDQPLRSQQSTTANPGAESSSGKVVKKTKPLGRKELLDDLFNRLGKAQSNRQARGIVRSIERTWLQSGSDTADLLMQRALIAMKKKNNTLALQLLDKVVFLEPAWPEVWNKRATVRYFADDPDGAVADIAQVLSREPRHFSALVGLGFILRQAKQDKLALQVFRHALKINPRLTDITTIIEKLTVAVEGQGI